MKVDNLTIISGLPGSGKSRLVKVYAEVLGARSDNKRYLFLPVQPRWSDDVDLLGYFNDLRGLYEHTDLSELLRFASEDSDHAYVVCLDEMNLARVEHYLSRFLSVFQQEEAERNIDLFPEEKKSANGYPNQISLEAGNVFFVGTINLDESIIDFSNRLLDRANLVELEVRSDSFIESMKASTNKVKNPSKLPAIPMKTFKQFRVTNQSEPTLEPDESELLLKINKILEDTGLDIHFAHRVPQQIAKFIANFKSYGLISYGEKATHHSERHLALDIQICQRILTKVRGSATDLCSSERRGGNDQTPLGHLKQILKKDPLSTQVIDRKIKQAERYRHVH